MLSNRPVVLDACVLINLLASGRIEELAMVTAPERLVCEAVRAEALFLRTPEDGDGREPVDLTPHLLSGVLAVTRLQSSEEERFVAYARDLDDGEAMSLAIAEVRGLPLATDDRKAKAIAARAAAPIQLIGTTDILFAWAGGRGRGLVADTIRRMSDRARFVPARNDPRLGWWLKTMAG